MYLPTVKIELTGTLWQIGFGELWKRMGFCDILGVSSIHMHLLIKHYFCPSCITSMRRKRREFIVNPFWRFDMPPLFLCMVISPAGVLWKEATLFKRRLGSLLFSNWEQPFSAMHYGLVAMLFLLLSIYSVPILICVAGGHALQEATMLNALTSHLLTWSVQGPTSKF